jgi:hypothetical protein
MTLPVSGAISFNAINVELGVAGTTTANINQSSYRTLAGVASGQISLSNFYGKANQFAFTIASNQTNANLRTLAVNAGWNGTSRVVATINSGVYVYSTSTGTPALTVNGSFPNGVQLNNNGTIQGMGGGGGVGGYRPGGVVQATAGGGGGLALSVSVAVSINNANRIAGGGGGGGGAGYITRYYGKMQGTDLSGSSGGGGLGGGAGGAAVGSLYAFTPNAGQAGTLTSAGAGGAAKVDAANSGQYNLAGASGGSYGSAGGTGPTGNSAGGGGGAAGGAVSGNANITWIATGTRNGGIS